AFGASPRAAFAWGYGHYALFAAVGAVGAGLEVALDHTAGQTVLSDWQSGATLTVPVAVYLVSVWALHVRHKEPGPMRTFAVPLTAAVVLASTGLGQPVLATGAACAVLLAAAVVTEACRPSVSR
ncbi:MAG TPA: low temperature requirement protein A, partial [Acidimicrobiia bacterium]